MNETQAKNTSELYFWQGYDQAGIKSSGFSYGNNSTLVKLALFKKGIITTKIYRPSRLFFLLRQYRLSYADITVFTRQLAALLTVGLPLVSALDIMLTNQSKLAMQDLLLNIKNELADGTPLSTLIQHRSYYFDGAYSQLIKIGEETGNLPYILEMIATHREKMSLIKHRIKRALSYPIIVFVVAIIVGFIILSYVVPQFAALFQGFHQELPLLTRLLFRLSNTLRPYNGYFLAAVVLFFYGAVRIATIRRLLNRIAKRIFFHLPFIDTIYHYLKLEKFARSCALMFAAGLSLRELLSLLTLSESDNKYALALQKMVSMITAGATFSQALTQTGLFPPLYTQMIAIGEEAGGLSAMSAKIADYYANESQIKIDTLLQLLEPGIMILLSMVIGVLIVALYLPIFQSGTIL